MGQSTQDSHLTNSIMKMFVVLALAALAAAEPEADPQLLLGGIHGVHTPYTHVAPVSTYSSPLLRTLVNPVNTIIPAVRTVVPEVKTVLSTPLVSTYSQYPYGVAHPHGVIAAPRTIITNYKDSEHYTAEATPLGKALGEPSYVAKNGEVVHEVQKREAEADSALFYSGLTHTPTVYNTGVVRPITYASSAIRPISYTNSMVNPFTYTYNTAAVNPVVYNTPATVNPVVYNTPAIVKAYDHGIAATPFGAVHSSHVGKCLNNEGAE